MAAITISSDFETQKNKVSNWFHCFPIYLPWSGGPDAMIFIFWMLSFKPTSSLSSFTFIKRLFSSSLSALRVVSSAYLRLLIFLPAILIPACAPRVTQSHPTSKGLMLNSLTCSDDKDTCVWNQDALAPTLIFQEQILVRCPPQAGERESRSVMSNSLRPHGLYPCNPMEFSRPEYWNG